LDTPFVIAMVLFMLPMAGVALINMPIMTAGINALPHALIPHGTAVINTARQFGGTQGLTFIISLISRPVQQTATMQPHAYVTCVMTPLFVAFVFALTDLDLHIFVQNIERSVLK